MKASDLIPDRYHAGLQLAELITKAKPTHPIIYGIPRGGVLVAAPISQQLNCPLDVAIAKKIVLPAYPETAIGAVTANGHGLETGKKYCTDAEWLQAVQQAQNKVEGLLRAFAPFRPQVEITGATAILVDDGIATGATIGAIASAMRTMPYKEIWVAAPVAPMTMPSIITAYIDKTILLVQPLVFMSVSSFYNYFPEVTTSESLSCFQLANS
jgi:putative phosphoribosyl transferase